MLPSKAEESAIEKLLSGVDLSHVLEEDDVQFDFYYNMQKLTLRDTLYELLYYQPTHRTIDSPSIIYFKIRDPSNKEKVQDTSAV